MAIRETRGLSASSTKFRLQYSTSSTFGSSVYYVGEIGSTTTLWNYGDGIDNDNDPITQARLSVGSVLGIHNETGSGTNSFVHPTSSIVEYEFTLKNNGAANGTTYYFRPVYIVATSSVGYTSGFSYARLVAGTNTLTFTITGLGSGTTTEGVVTNVGATVNSIPFGSLTPNISKIAAHRFTINTNAGSGYQLYAAHRQELSTHDGLIIQPVVGSNEVPQPWPLLPSTSAFGYHTSDKTLSGPFSGRFASIDTYARFEDTLKEIGYSATPVANKVVDLIYRTEITPMQPAGDYDTEIMYILTPAFY
jgi:hypothetical protein